MHVPVVHAVCRYPSRCVKRRMPEPSTSSCVVCLMLSTTNTKVYRDAMCTYCVMAALQDHHVCVWLHWCLLSTGLPLFFLYAHTTPPHTKRTIPPHLNRPGTLHPPHKHPQGSTSVDLWCLWMQQQHTCGMTSNMSSHHYSTTTCLVCL